MTVKIEKSIANGAVKAPPSKSIAHRALICGALTKESTVYGISSYSKDIDATLSCLEKMGASVKKGRDFIKIGGLDPFCIPENSSVFCNESGSTLRFLIPFCMLSGNNITLSGSKRLFERPLSVYEDICAEQNIIFKKTEDCVSVCGTLKNGDYFVPGNISSQFITGLLFVLPLLPADSTLTVEGKFESASYVDLTLDVMRDFGVIIERQNNVFYIKGGQSYSSSEYTVEGDCSNAAFLAGFNCLGGNVDVLGLRNDTLQGDRVYADMYSGLEKGIRCFDLSDCPDLAPVMFAIASYYGGAEFTGTARLKLKESDRAGVMAKELSKFGVNVNIYENSVVIGECVLKEPNEVLYGHNDHRVVMALSLLCSVKGGVIEGAEAVNKSFPDFFEKISLLGIKIKEI
ncbi:MAG: 3-phosphoshikimate 1-carboxyvinyltransferase [Ruminococcaceae bacterium]|nr:3-phosphoshikimate 1-carboxyvinyltransferase [Oscillospiraceae bacterium]